MIPEMRIFYPTGFRQFLFFILCIQFSGKKENKKFKTSCLYFSLSSRRSEFSLFPQWVGMAKAKRKGEEAPWECENDARPQGVSSVRHVLLPPCAASVHLSRRLRRWPYRDINNPWHQLGAPLRGGIALVRKWKTHTKAGKYKMCGIPPIERLCLLSCESPDSSARSFRNVPML
jgi:hypothetical protein